ncbi:MAG TPA: hypothetical protein VMD29_08670 [Terracidiphilus sp.]|nr:hypothetical protein [Terracidiphilus sp.]
MSTLTAVVALATSVQASAQRLISFDAPNSGTGAYQGTAPTGINNSGTITGSVTDSSYGTHGFVRTSDGKYISFDVPGADPIVGCTCPLAINDLGVVAGEYIDTNTVQHGFVRYPDGKVETFDAPGAGADPGSYEGTWSAVINNLGVVTGDFYDVNYVTHGYVRAPDGKITTYDDPAGGTESFQGTYAYSINDFGVITGAVDDANNGSHGFLRSPDGKFTDFDFPGETSTTSNSAYINDFGVIAGAYNAPGSNLSTGFQRLPDGRITVFEAPGAGSDGSSGLEGTFVTALNLEGSTAGYIGDANEEHHSFMRDANGKVTVFDVPGQLAVPGSGLGSAGEAINDGGVVAGEWHDANYVAHGFIWIP